MLVSELAVPSRVQSDLLPGFPVIVDDTRNGGDGYTASWPLRLPGGEAGIAYTMYSNSAANQRTVLLKRVGASGLVLPGETTIVPEAEVVALDSRANVIAAVWTYRAGVASVEKEVRAQLFDGSGIALNPYVVVATETDLGYGSLATAFDSSGALLVVYGSGSAPFVGRMLDSTGTALGPEFPVTGAVVPGPQLAGLVGGGFVIAWASETQTLARRLDSAGTALGSEIVVSATGTLQAIDASKVTIAAAPDGGFWIAWLVPADYGNVMLRKYDASGTPSTSEILVDDEDDPYISHRASIAVDPDGKVFVRWMEGYGTWAPRGRLFGADGTPLSGEVRLLRERNEYIGPPLAVAPGTFIAPGTFSRETNCTGRVTVVLHRFCDDSVADCNLCPGVPNTLDADADGVADACDPCTGQNPAQEIHLDSLQYVTRPGGSRRPPRFVTRGSLVLGAPVTGFQPELNGLRILLSSTNVGTIGSWTLPGGALQAATKGWRVNAERTKWIYRNYEPEVMCNDAIDKVVFKRRTSDPSGFLKFQISGREASSTCGDSVTTSDLPFTLTISENDQAAATAGLCSEGTHADLTCKFSGPTTEEESCNGDHEPISVNCR